MSHDARVGRISNLYNACTITQTDDGVFTIVIQVNILYNVQIHMSTGSLKNNIAFPCEGYFTIPLSSKNSTGSLSLPCSHINERNQIPLSSIQKSAGVKIMLESSGFLSLSGVYSACQLKSSPCQYLPS